jgi:hypothetical protein
LGQRAAVQARHFTRQRFLEATLAACRTALDHAQATRQETSGCIRP